MNRSIALFTPDEKIGGRYICKRTKYATHTDPYKRSFDNFILYFHLFDFHYPIFLGFSNYIFLILLRNIS